MTKDSKFAVNSNIFIIFPKTRHFTRLWRNVITEMKKPFLDGTELWFILFK